MVVTETMDLRMVVCMNLLKVEESYNGFGNGCGIFGRNGGFNNRKDVLDSFIVVILCQICFELKHTTAECKNNTTNSLFIFSTIELRLLSNLHSKGAYLKASKGELVDHGWYLDSGSIHHLINNL